MRKIPTLFERNWQGDHLVNEKVTPGCEWVLRGEGVATVKKDGTACMVHDGRLYKRFELKSGKSTPVGFEPAQEPDAITGDIPGWIPVGDGPEDKWHREAWQPGIPDGTYELIGPKVQGNHYQLPKHVLVRHGVEVIEAPRTYVELRVFLQDADIEGIVWHSPNGMCKLKKRDFGFKW